MVAIVFFFFSVCFLGWGVVLRACVCMHCKYGFIGKRLGRGGGGGGEEKGEEGKGEDV